MPSAIWLLDIVFKHIFQRGNLFRPIWLSESLTLLFAGVCSYVDCAPLGKTFKAPSLADTHKWG